MSELSFVNVDGAPVDTNRRVAITRKKKNRGEFHDGFVVRGISPAQMKTDIEAHAAARASEINAGAKRIRPEWNLDAWLPKAKRKRVRSKPYELKQAAELCADMARKEGWLAVEVKEIKKGGAS